MNRPYRGIVLAAGLGTRLAPLTERLPKPLVQLGPERLIETTIRRLVDAGITEIAVNLHHLPAQIPAALGSGSALGCSLTYFHEPVILGTGGALKNASDFLGRHPFVVTNSDMVMDLDLGAMLSRHEESGAMATLALRPREARRYGALLIDGEGRVVDVLGKLGRQEPGLIEAHFTGVQVLEPGLLARLPDGTSETPRDLWLPLLKEEGPQALAAYSVEGYFSDVGTWSRLLETHRERFPSGYLAPSAKLLGEIQRVGAVTIGPGSEIQGPASLSDAIVLPGSRVPPGDYRRGVFHADLFIPAPGEP